MRFKVCSVTQLTDLDAIHKAGIQFIGLNFYKPSQAYAPLHFTAEEFKQTKTPLYKVGVFVNEPLESIIKTVNDFGLDMVQLHGDERPYFCEQVSNYVSVIKAFRLRENDHIEWLIKDYWNAADMYMFDTMGVGYGGTGKKLNWRLLKGLNINKPFFLSGGVEPGDATIIRSLKNDATAKDLFAVDLTTPFSNEDGSKNIESIREFVREIQS